MRNSKEIFNDLRTHIDELNMISLRVDSLATMLNLDFNDTNSNGFSFGNEEGGVLLALLNDLTQEAKREIVKQWNMIRELMEKCEELECKVSEVQQ